MKTNAPVYYQIADEVKKNEKLGCGRTMLFRRTATGEPRVCGVTGQCDACRASVKPVGR